MRRNGEPLRKHGFCTRKRDKRKYRVFLAWQAMLWRCYCKSNGAYKNYGGRGIRVCYRWRSSFTNFLQDMGMPAKWMTLGRRNNNKGYSPANCRWETIKQQNDNKRTTRRISFSGKSMPLGDWARIVKLPRARIIQRLKRGWSVKDALFVPRRQQKNLAAIAY